MPEQRFPDGSVLRADAITLGDGVEIGPGVEIEATSIDLGDGVKIGVLDEESFRQPGGVRIKAGSFRLGARGAIGRAVAISGGDITLGDGVRIDHGSTIKISRSLRVGAGGRIQARADIAGVTIDIGRRLWMLPDAKIGGGGAFEVHSSFTAGHWLHLGTRSLINTARAVRIGHEVGLGTGTSLYTHGAYPSALEGKPVGFAEITVGDRVWVPGAVVNPGVTLGDDCIVAVGSVVTRDVPAGALAAGAPAKVVREGAYPAPLQGEARLAFLRDFLQVFAEISAPTREVVAGADGLSMTIDGIWLGYTETPDDIEEGIVLTDAEPSAPAGKGRTVIELGARIVDGAASALTERLLDQMRRYGIRFNYEPVGDRYAPWPETEPA